MDDTAVANTFITEQLVQDSQDLIYNIPEELYESIIAVAQTFTILYRFDSVEFRLIHIVDMKIVVRHFECDVVFIHAAPYDLQILDGIAV